MLLLFQNLFAYQYTYQIYIDFIKQKALQLIICGFGGRINFYLDNRYAFFASLLVYQLIKLCNLLSSYKGTKSRYH